MRHFKSASHCFVCVFRMTKPLLSSLFDISLQEFDKEPFEVTAIRTVCQACRYNFYVCLCQYCKFIAIQFSSSATLLRWNWDGVSKTYLRFWKICVKPPDTHTVNTFLVNLFFVKSTLLSVVKLWAIVLTWRSFSVRRHLGNGKMKDKRNNGNRLLEFKIPTCPNSKSFHFL